MKILVTGRNGQVGWELERSLQPLGEVIALDRRQLDLEDLKGVRETVREIKPDVIVNAAAYTAVDKAEEDETTATRINGEAPGVLADEAKRLDALMVHYSTDYVFDGTKKVPYTEDDEPNPINAYGRSKLVGEGNIQAAGGSHLILRTSWVYSARGNNFLRTILRLAKEREELAIVSDQIGSPTWARFIADATAHIVRKSLEDRSNNQFQPNLYHLTAAGETSWFGFTQSIIEQAQSASDCSLRLKTITPIPTRDYPTPAQRPMNSRLATVKLEKHYGLQMPFWNAALQLCLTELY